MHHSQLRYLNYAADAAFNVMWNNRHLASLQLSLLHKVVSCGSPLHSLLSNRPKFCNQGHQPEADLTPRANMAPGQHLALRFSIQGVGQIAKHSEMQHPGA